MRDRAPRWGRWATLVSLLLTGLMLWCWWLALADLTDVARARTALAGVASRGSTRVVPRVSAAAAVAPISQQPAPLRASQPAGTQPATQQATRLVGAARDPLSSYLEQAQYPPTSRPLTAGQTDLIAWNARHERVRVSSDDPNVSYRFSADRYWLSGDQPLALTLEAWVGPPQARSAAPIVIERAAAVPLDVDVEPSHVMSRLTLRRAGTAYWGQVRARDLGLHEAPSRVRLGVVFRVAGGPEQTAVIHAVFSPSAPARFSGRFRDEVVEGSLVVWAQLEVAVAGRYLIDVNLWHDETPVAWTRFKGELERGTRWLPLRFFGKVLRDAGDAGGLADDEPLRFRLGQLRGGLHRPEREPDMMMMEPFAGTWLTRPRPLATFSAAEWDSPSKRARVRKLRGLLAGEPGPRLQLPSL